jgi:hypothetical protein
VLFPAGKSGSPAATSLFSTDTTKNAPDIGWWLARMFSKVRSPARQRLTEQWRQIGYSSLNPTAIQPAKAMHTFERQFKGIHGILTTPRGSTTLWISLPQIASGS